MKKELSLEGHGEGLCLASVPACLEVPLGLLLGVTKVPLVYWSCTNELPLT